MTLDAVDGRSLRSGFLQHAAARPDTPALVVRDVAQSYGQMDDRARRLAGLLVAALGRAPERVGTFASRSETAYVATLGALYAGAAYVPLNLKFPVERTRAMALRAQLDAIVVDRASAVQLREVLTGLTPAPLVVAPDAGVAASLRGDGVACLGADELAATPPLDALPPVLVDDIAYLLFTSGTTGEPKGVGVTHANALHFLDAAAERYQLAPGDRCSQTFDQTFDLAVFDLFMAWNAGACLYSMQPIEQLAPVRFVQKHALTLWFSVPSAAALAVKKNMLRPDSMPTLRYSLFCGEPLPDATAAAWQGAAPASHLENLYGPTELTIACLVYRWEAATSPAEAVNGIVPIGRPLTGLGTLVVDDALQPVASGEVGELLVCGPQTTPGYWLDTATTAERFVEVELSPTRRKRFYRTGDRVFALPSGSYGYVGRTDNQIKVLGFRVELGEIEAVLLRGPGVVQAAAVGWPLEDGRAMGTVAFVTGTDLAPDALKRDLGTSLPDYMIPSRVVVLDEMPLNSNGKIDRRQLASSLEIAATQPG